MRKNVILETGLSGKKACTLNKVCIDKNRRPVSKMEISIVGFTLVELIVVITILAILGTIAIMAFSGYSKNARDSARVSDISRIVSSVELFQVAKGFFPEPTGGVPVTYSGATAWTQGTFGDSMVTNVEKINKKPVDPLTASEYTYSVTAAKKEFQIGAIYEGDSLASVVNQTYAAEVGKALVKGNYNGSILKVSTGSVDYILAIPSILASDIELSSDVLEIVGNDRLVFDKYSNLPASYKGTSYEVVGSFGYNKTEAELVVFSGSVLDLNDETKQLTFFKNLQDAYVGTVVSNEPEIKNILAYDTSANEEGSLFTAQVLLNNNVTNSVKLTATNQNNAGGNTGGGGSGGDTGGNTTVTQIAGNFNYKFYEESLVPGVNNGFIADDRGWTPIEIASGKVMIMESVYSEVTYNEELQFGIVNVATNGDLTHSFSVSLANAVNYTGSTNIYNSYYHFDNVLNLGNGKFIVIGKDPDNQKIAYYLFHLDINTQVLTFHNKLDVSTYVDPLNTGNGVDLAGFLDDGGNLRVAYVKTVAFDQNSYTGEYEIWMHKVSTIGNIFTLSEDQKILDLRNGSTFGYNSSDYIDIRAITMEKVSNNRGIFFVNTKIKGIGVDGVKGYNNTTYEDDDVDLEKNVLYAFGINFGGATYSTGTYKKLNSSSLGADWPFFTQTVGGDRVVLTTVGYRSEPNDEETYVVVSKLNQSTLEITSGSPTILSSDEGYYFLGITKINDNKIIVAGEKNPIIGNYGDTIENGKIPFGTYDIYFVENIASLVFPIYKQFVYEFSTGNSYKVSGDYNSISQITTYQDPWNPESTGSLNIDGGAFWEIDLGVGNLTPISVNTTLAGNQGDFSSNYSNAFWLDDTRAITLSSGQIYMTSTFDKYTGAINENGELVRAYYPHIILTPN